MPLHGDDGRGDGDEPCEPREQHGVDAGAERGGGGALPVHVGGAELQRGGVPRGQRGGVEHGEPDRVPAVPQLRGRRGDEHGRERLRVGGRRADDVEDRLPEYTAASGGHGSAAPRAIGKSCNAASCHDSAARHDTSAALTGANPFRLVDQVAGGGVDYSCAYTGAGCHVTGVSGPQTNLLLSTLTTHSRAAMTAAGYTPKRTWPAWDPQCANCHDPHGDGNLSMVSRWTYDKAAFNIPTGSGRRRTRGRCRRRTRR